MKPCRPGWRLVLFLSNAVIEGRYLLRACIVNFRTSSQDIAEIPAIVARHGRLVHEELKSARPLEFRL